MSRAASFILPAAVLLGGCGGGSSSNLTGGTTPPALTSVSITSAATTVNIGATVQFTATAKYSDGSSTDVTTSATWSSSDATVASIQSTGQANPGLGLGVAAGAANITASFKAMSGQATLTVNSGNISPIITSIAVGPAGASVSVGSTVQFTATASYSDGSVKPVTTTVAWSSSNSAIASIQTSGQTTPGLATAVAPGQATITASLDGISGNVMLTVTSKATVISLSISPTAASLNVGSTLQFTATAGYSDGSSKTVTNSAAWSSSNSAVASIQTSGQTGPGLARGKAPGNVNVTASFNGVSAITTLNVIGNTGNLTAFLISQIDPSIPPGSPLQMFGYAEYADGSAQWVTSTTHWTSSNPSVASVEDQGQTSPGLVTASAAGTTTITASYGGFNQTTMVTVASNAVPTDLMDMSSSQNYLDLQGGLYENSSDVVPSDHDTAGTTAATEIQPLDQNGNPGANGAVVFLGIGMSNASQEFSAFAATAESNSSVNHLTLAIENGALGAATACYWTVAQGQTLAACPDAAGILLDNEYDRVRDTVLATASGAPSATPNCGPAPATPCLTEKQVQVIWIKNANPRPGIANERALCDATVAGCVNDTGTEAILYESQLGKTIRAAKSRYPNLKQIFLSTRIYAGYATDGLNPEPYAYEYGYSAKWLIEAQIVQERNGTIDPVAGDLSYSSGTAAWTAWGTYLWADGTIARSDGTTWLQSDFQSDGTHPDGQGTTKVVNLLMTFFLGSPYTPWFRP